MKEKGKGGLGGERRGGEGEMKGEGGEETDAVGLGERKRKERSEFPLSTLFINFVDMNIVIFPRSGTICTELYH